MSAQSRNSRQVFRELVSCCCRVSRRYGASSAAAHCSRAASSARQGMQKPRAVLSRTILQKAPQQAPHKNSLASAPQNIPACSQDTTSPYTTTARTPQQPVHTSTIYSCTSPARFTSSAHPQAPHHPPWWPPPPPPRPPVPPRSLAPSAAPPPAAKSTSTKPNRDPPHPLLLLSVTTVAAHPR